MEEKLPSILVVEDTPESLAYARFALRSLGKILCAYSAKDAYEILEREKVDLILLDLKMPDKDGLVMLFELKNHPVYKDIKVVISSGSSAPWDIEAALNLGATGYMVKPWSLDEFREKVRGFLYKGEEP